MPVYKAATNSGSSLSQLFLAQAVSGNWYLSPTAVQGNFNVATGSNSTAYYQPIWLATGTLDRIAVNHFSTTGGAGEVARLGIYSNDATAKNKPGSLLVDAGTVDLTTATAVKSLTISQAVTDGLYWLCVARQGGASATANLVAVATTTGNAAPGVNIPTDSTTLYNNAKTLYSQSSVTGALPSTATPASSTFSNLFAVAVRYA